MVDLFNRDELSYISHSFESERASYEFDSDGWLVMQRSELSQFSGETRKAPADQILIAIGYLVWSCSIFEEKLSRSVFWLQCLKAKEIQELPGQGTKIQSRMGELNKLLHDSEIASVIGASGIEWTRAMLKETKASLRFRDDVLHGHHMGGWMEGAVMRVPGKLFDRDSSRFLELTAGDCFKHSRAFLETAAVLSLYDDHFDRILNG